MPGVHRATRPPVRLRAVPPLDPPFDDESAAVWTVSPGPDQLTFDLPGTNRSNPRTRPPGGTRPGRRRPPAPLHPLPLPPEALASATPEARQAARRFLVRCLEILNGHRPISHVRPLAVPDRAVDILGQLALGADRLVTPHRRAGHRYEPVKIRRVRVCEPRPGIAEAAVVLGSGDRAWALAFRVERHRGSWLATALQVV